MTIGHTAGTTHPGRKRRRNEDSFVLDPPLFAVADGMGGAQAGALASRLAAGVLRGDESSADGATAEERVAGLIQEANRRVHQRATEDEQATGMGTTMTVALVEDDRVVIGHVGDSRAYRIRAGELQQLTEDHSLVAELVRSGRLSPEEADSHPQRSVITRALGPDPDVDVDTFSVPIRPGDVFLLCSDGLTSMVGDNEIVGIVSEHHADLESAAGALVQAANAAGGDDNITVVCFEIVGAGDAAAQTHEAPVVRAAPSDEEDTLDELAEVPAPSLTVIREAPVIPPPAEEPAVARRIEPAAPPAGRRPRRRRRVWIPATIVVVLLALAIVGGLWVVSRAHFVGSDSNGHVAVYQGLPYDVVDGVRLYRAVYVSPRLRTAQLTQEERGLLFDHDLQSKSAAMARVKVLERRIGLGR